MPSLAQNKKAFHDYIVLDRYEAGIVLTGAEIKSVKNGGANLKGSYITIKNGEIWTQNMHISPYKYASDKDFNPLRNRKLLLKKKEILKIASLEHEKGITIIPLAIHLKNNYAKIEIGICKGKKMYDKRNDLKKKSQKLEIDRSLANR